jgi:hypothetical protein
MREINWEGGLLLPGQKQRVTFRTMPHSWGVGIQKKMIVLKYPDHSHTMLVVSGEGLAAEETPELRLATDEVAINLNGELASDVRLERYVTVKHKPDMVDHLNVRANVGWLSTSIRSTDDTTAQIRVQITGCESLVKELLDDNMAEARIEVSSRKSKFTASARVILRREPLVYAFPDLIRVARSENASKEVTLRPSSDRYGAIVGVSILDEWKPLGVTVEPSNGEGYKVRINLREKPLYQYCVIKCLVALERQDPSVVPIVVKCLDYGSSEKICNTAPEEQTAD